MKKARSVIIYCDNYLLMRSIILISVHKSAWVPNVTLKFLNFVVIDFMGFGEIEELVDTKKIDI